MFLLGSAGCAQRSKKLEIGFGNVAKPYSTGDIISVVPLNMWQEQYPQSAFGNIAESALGVKQRQLFDNIVGRFSPASAETLLTILSKAVLVWDARLGKLSGNIAKRFGAVLRIGFDNVVQPDFGPWAMLPKVQNCQLSGIIRCL